MTPEEFEDYVRQFYPILLRRARRHTREYGLTSRPLSGHIYRDGADDIPNDPNACDLVQETLLRAAKSFQAYRGHCAPKTWFYSILKRVIQENVRRARHLRLENALARAESYRPHPEPLAPEEAYELTRDQPTADQRHQGLWGNLRVLLSSDSLTDIPRLMSADELSPTSCRVYCCGRQCQAHNHHCGRHHESNPPAADIGEVNSTLVGLCLERLPFYAVHRLVACHRRETSRRSSRTSERRRRAVLSTVISEDEPESEEALTRLLRHEERSERIRAVRAALNTIPSRDARRALWLVYAKTHSAQSAARGLRLTEETVRGYIREWTPHLQRALRTYARPADPRNLRDDPKLRQRPSAPTASTKRPSITFQGLSAAAAGILSRGHLNRRFRETDIRLTKRLVPLVEEIHRQLGESGEQDQYPESGALPIAPSAAEVRALVRQALGARGLRPKAFLRALLAHYQGHPWRPRPCHLSRHSIPTAW